MTTIEFMKPAEQKSIELTWEHVPCIGDSVDLEQDAAGEYEDGFCGVVKTVVWWRDGSVRVVLT